MDHRSHLVDRIQLRLAEQEKQKQEILQRMSALDTRIQALFTDYRQSLDETGVTQLIAQGSAQGLLDYVHSLREERRREEATLHQQEQVLRGVREELKQALLKKKALEVLKDKGLQTFQQAVLKEEAVFLEELTLKQYHLKGDNQGTT